MNEVKKFGALKHLKAKLAMAVVGMTGWALSAPLWALGSDNTNTAEGDQLTEVGSLAETLQAWMGGDLGMLIVMVGLLVAVIMVVARASMMPVLFVLGLAIILGWGPAMFKGVMDMEVTAAMLAPMI